MNTDISKKLREFRESLFVSAPVVIEKITNYKTQRADVRMKIRHKNDKPPKILDVPLSHNESKTFSERRLPEKGDVAWAVFQNRAIDKVLEDAEIKEPEHDRVLDINDVFLAGEWSSDDDGIPESIGSMAKDDWLIGLHRDSGARVYIRAGSGNIVLEPPSGTNTLELTENPNYSVPKFEAIMNKYLQHTHSDPISGTTGPPVTGLWTPDDGSTRVGVDD